MDVQLNEVIFTLEPSRNHLYHFKHDPSKSWSHASFTFIPVQRDKLSMIWEVMRVCRAYSCKNCTSVFIFRQITSLRVHDKHSSPSYSTPPDHFIPCRTENFRKSTFTLIKRSCDWPLFMQCCACLRHAYVWDSFIPSSLRINRKNGKNCQFRWKRQLQPCLCRHVEILEISIPLHLIYNQYSIHTLWWLAKIMKRSCSNRPFSERPASSA